MPYPLDSESEADLLAGRLVSADLVDLYLVDGESDLTLRWWSWPDTLDFPANDHVDGTDPVTYVSMHGRMQLAKAVRQAATLAAEPLRIRLDASRSTDDTDEVGKFVDAGWHQRLVRVRQVLLNPDTAAAREDPVWEWHGRIDHRQLTDLAGEERFWSVTCEGGLFRVRGRRMRTRSHADQQRRSAGDNFYIGTANMMGRPLNWAKAPTNVPGTAASGPPSAPPLPGFAGSVIGSLWNRQND